jgi:positive regulator of sigma E activity
MEEHGRVTAVHGDRAEVEVVPGEACRSCSASGFCSWTGKRQKLLTARNPAQAGIGDTVVVSTPESGRSRSAGLVFGIPAVGMLAGVLLGSLFWGNTGAVVLGGIGLGAGLLAIKLIDMRAARSGRNLPVIIRRVDAGSLPECPTGPATDSR